VANKQQTPVCGHIRQPGKGLRCIEATRKWRVDLQALALVLAPPCASQLRGLLRAHLGTEQDAVKIGPEPCQRESGRAGLAFAARGQPALSVRACAVRLRLGVT
jgi:hypothetical protein